MAGFAGGMRLDNSGNPGPGGSGSSALDTLKQNATSGGGSSAGGTTPGTAAAPVGSSITSRTGQDKVYIATTVGTPGTPGKAPTPYQDDALKKGGTGKPGIPATPASDTYNTIDGALQDFYTWSRDKINKFRQLGALAGMNNMNANDQQLFQTWQQLTTQAANYTTAGRKVSPWDVLANAIPNDPLGLGRGKKGGGGGTGDFENNQGMDLLNKTPAQISAAAADAAGKAGGKTGSSGSSVSSVNGGLNQKQINVSRTIDYTDPDTARFVLNTAEATLLGRQATADEAKRFYSKLTQEESTYPKQSQSVFTPDGSGNVNTSPALSSAGKPAVAVDSNGNPVDENGNIVTPGAPQPNQQTGSTVTTSLNELDYQRYGREQVAQDFARQQPDYGAYQAAVPLMNAFLQAIGGPPGLK